MAQGSRWSPEEKALLAEAWARGGVAAAREALPHRAARAIAIKANKLGLPPHDKRPWTTVELRTLKQAMWQGGQFLAARMLPGRTPRACSVMATKMGYKRRSGWVSEVCPRVLTADQIDAAEVARRQGATLSFLAKALGVSHTSIRRALGGIKPMGLRTV